MPAPDGRQWWTPTQMAERVAHTARADGRLTTAMQQLIRQDEEAFVEVVRDAIGNSGFRYELTLLRLVEQIKDAIGILAFGPLVVPNTVDVEGLPIKTPVGEIHAMLEDCYTPEFLDQFDEEGNPLPIEPEGS